MLVQTLLPNYWEFVVLNTFSCLCCKICRIHFFFIQIVNKILTFACTIKSFSCQWQLETDHFQSSLKYSWICEHVAFKSCNLVSINDSLSSRTKIEMLRNILYRTNDAYQISMMSLISFAKSQYFGPTLPLGHAGHWYVVSAILCFECHKAMVETN